MDGDSQYPSLELVYELTVEQLRGQIARIEALDAKIATVVGFTGVLLILTVTAGERIDAPPGPLAAAAVLLLGSVLILLLALRVRRYRFDPDVRVLRQDYLNLPVDQTRIGVIDTVVEALDANDEQLRWKGRLLNAGGALTCAALTCVAGAAVYSFVMRVLA